MTRSLFQFLYYICTGFVRFSVNMKNILSTNNLRTGAAWLFLVVGLILYAAGFFWINDESIWSRISIKIADVLVIGVVLGFITNAAQFIGIFKQDLQDII